MGYIGSSLAALALGMIVTGAGAQEDMIAKRKDAMKAAGKSMFGSLGQMSRERRPYDQAAVDAALAQLESFSKSIGPLYPESTRSVPRSGDYSASDKVWEDPAGFEAHLADLAKAIDQHKGKIDDLDKLKAAFPEMSRSCSGCHETYRVKNG